MKVIPCYGKNHMSKPIPFFKWLHLWPARRWKRPMRVVAPVMDMFLFFQLQGKQGELSLTAVSDDPGL